MKRFLFLILIMLPCVSASYAHVVDSLNIHQINTLPQQQTDSLFKIIINEMPISSSPENFKLYPTQNIWTFLKLDTRTGAIWQLQYDVQGNNHAQHMIYGGLTTSFVNYTEINRFELYPTDNIYNFLLLDKKDGYVYQIQWHTNAKSRGLIHSYISYD